MAAKPFSTTRRALIGAAAALPFLPLTADTSAEASAKEEARALWNRRLADYRRLLAAKEAEETAGAFRTASDLYDAERAAIVARFGSWDAARETEQGRALCRAAFTPMNAAEEAFYDDFTAPLQRAAVALAQTQTPDPEALLAKIRVIQEHELEELGCMPRPVLELLAEDVERLRGTLMNTIRTAKC